MSAGSVRRAAGGAFLLAATALLATGSCAPTLPAGELGTLRYAGRVKGEAPLNLLPPVSDPSGNLYVLNGAPKLPETHAFVGFVGGGWGATCTLTKGDVFGAHGWAGFATARQWYWSGAALVSVSGTDGSCHPVLDKDPSTGADLTFEAVLPAVRNRSQRATLVAFVQTPTDPTPFSALVDLDAEFLTNVRAFRPTDAEDVAVIGVGGDRERELGVALVQYRQGGAAHLEVRSYDGDASLLGTADVRGGPFAPYAVQGYLQIDGSGLVAGLLASADDAGSLVLLTADGRGGQVVPVTGMEPVGVHLWGGALWLVGVAGGGPVIARVSLGGIGAVTPWGASVAAARALGASTTLRDDRSLPSRTTTWTGVKTAVGAFPFLSPHGLTKHAPETTLWVFAGPTVKGSALALTSFAVAPVGVTYP
jgi:hypothetical protein